MLLSAVSVLVVAQSSSEIPEGLMNNLVLLFIFCVCISNDVISTVNVISLLFFVLIELSINVLSGYTESLSNYFYIFEN